MNCKIVIFTSLILISNLFARDPVFYYLSEEENLLETTITIKHQLKKYSFSVRPYGGFLIKKTFLRANDDKTYTVQINGTLLEKDWPSVPLALKIGDVWKLEIQKDGVSDGIATLAVTGLTKIEADKLVEVLKPLNNSKVGKDPK